MTGPTHDSESVLRVWITIAVHSEETEIASRVGTSAICTALFADLMVEVLVCEQLGKDGSSEDNVMVPLAALNVA